MSGGEHAGRGGRTSPCDEGEAVSNGRALNAWEALPPAFAAQVAALRALPTEELRAFGAAAWGRIDGEGPHARPTRGPAKASNPLRLSSLEERSAAELFGAVVFGAVVDDECDVDDATLALALECWRAAQTLSGTVELLRIVRPGEPWGEWVSSACAAWLAIEPQVARMKAMTLAALVARESSRLELERIEAFTKFAERARSEIEANGARTEWALGLVAHVGGAAGG